jgi:hypothetical protein
MNSLELVYYKRVISVVIDEWQAPKFGDGLRSRQEVPGKDDVVQRFGSYFLHRFGLSAPDPI